MEVLKLDSEDLTNSYSEDKFDRAVLKKMNGDQMPDQVLSKKIDKFLPLFHNDGDKLLYDGKLCVPKNSTSTVMQLAYDAKTSGHFEYLKMLSRLKNYHRKHKSQDVKQYAKGCMVCQQKKDYLGKKLTYPTSLEVP